MPDAYEFGGFHLDPGEHRLLQGSQPRCGNRLQLVALIEEAAVVGAILRHLGLPTEIPVPRPPRAPPLPLTEARRAGGPVDAPEWDPC